MRKLIPLGQQDAGAAQAAAAIGGAAAAGASVVGAKAARLAQAQRSGLPVLPGWVVPVAEGRPALRAGAAAVAGGNPAGARRAVLKHWFDADLAAELREATILLGGRVIARSSSPLESDARWSGAFSSVTGAGPDEAAVAVRSCWSSAFAKDPLERLARSGLLPEALELAVLLQPEIRPDAGGVARVRGGEVEIEGVAGHPGPLLSGWAEGAIARVPLPAASASPVPAPSPAGGALAGLIGKVATALVARLAQRVNDDLGDDTIEWAIADGQVWLLQSRRSPMLTEPASPASPGAQVAAAPPPGPASWPGAPGEGGEGGGGAPGIGALLGRAHMPFLAERVLAAGRRVPSRPAVPGTAAGRLIRCRPHEPVPPGDEDAILLVDRPLPALAPLLFGARGLIARSGAAGSHLAEVARSLGVPMITGCRPETVTGAPPRPGTTWLAAIDGTTGAAAFLPA